MRQVAECIKYLQKFNMYTSRCVFICVFEKASIDGLSLRLDYPDVNQYHDI